MRFTQLFLLVFALISGPLLADETVPAKPVQMVVQSYKNSNDLFIALSYENHPKWHTYWKNPGDAGLPIKTTFTVDGKEIKLEEEEWPAPRRFIEEGNLWAYGYEGAYTFFYKASKKTLNSFAGKEISVRSTWLVCKHICIPGEKKVDFKLVGEAVESKTPDLLTPLAASTLTERFQNLPKQIPLPQNLEIKLSKGVAEKTLVLSYKVKNVSDMSIVSQTNLLFAFPQAPFDFRHENLSKETSAINGTMEISWDGEYQDPPVDLPKDGRFKKPYKLRFLYNDPIQKKTVLLEKTFDRFDLAPVTVQQSPTETNAKEVVPSPSNAGSTVVMAQSTQSLFYYLIVAFLGGLILNVMPCVLPVISLKLFGLIKYKNESRRMIIRHNIFYTLGILVTFIALAAIIVLLKGLGSQVGWGFQLQSPLFIALMIVFLFIFALNLFGVFEFKTPGGKHLGNVQTKEGFVGDFLSGILATILSTPCSAPFLGTALTFAFSSSTWEIMLVFIMIGLGLASPFIITAFFPQLVSFLPKPGNWMNTLKKILGLTLILTILWLFDVYNALVDGSSHLIKLGVSLVFIYAGFLLYKKDKWFGLAGFLASLLIFINLSSTEIVHSNDEQTALIRDKQSHGLNWEPWSEKRMADYKATNQAVFIDFTAKWCFTCKVNERLVLDTDKFKAFAEDKNLKLLIGDWTKRDEVIGSFLRKNGMVGVPAYFVQKKDGTLVNLGETITIERINQHLD